tara:strand:+ start:4377 stop:5321 length:945 start_codon:yes stop_codon:yes gene_type:complete
VKACVGDVKDGTGLIFQTKEVVTTVGNNEFTSSVLMTIRLKESPAHLIDCGIVSIDRSRLINTSLDIMIQGIIDFADRYTEQFHKDKNIVIGYQEFIAEKWRPSDPYLIRIWAESVDALMVDDPVLCELQNIVSEFMALVLEHGADLIMEGGRQPLTLAQSDFAKDYTADFISRHEEKKITKPFLCSFPGKNKDEIPVQGTIKRAVREQEGFEESTFLAVSDGARGDDLVVYLRELDDSGRPYKQCTDKYIAESDEFLIAASLAFANDFKVVKATVLSRVDAKGKLRKYLRAIQPISRDEYEECQKERQLPLQG